MFLVLVAVVTLLGIAALVFRQTDWGSRQIPRAYAIGVLVGVTILGVVASGAYFVLTGLRPSRPPHPIPSGALTSALSANSNVPLIVGSSVPSLDAEGWVNHEPSEKTKPAKLTVIDIWGTWCPVVRDAAPGLVEVYRQYESQDVEFVSLTSDSRESATHLAKTFNITWPSGYGISREMLASLGALNNGMPGYDSIPTLYLIDSNGRVLWSDLQQRYHHKDVDALRTELQQQIDKALAESRAAN